MADPAGPGPLPQGRPTLAVKVGGRTLTGATAIAVLVLLLGLVVALLVWMRPSLGMLLSGALWVAFVLYWGAAAKNAAPTESAESPASRAVHTRLLNASLLLLFLPVPGLTGRFMPGGSSIVAGGLAVQALGFMLAGWARHHLGRNWSGAVAVAVGHQLVRSGPYRVVRHPIYSAMFGMYVGTSVVSGQWHALLALALLAVAYARKIPIEERTLRSTFPDYDDYRRDTWALIPGLY